MAGGRGDGQPEKVSDGFLDVLLAGRYAVDTGVEGGTGGSSSGEKVRKTWMMASKSAMISDASTIPPVAAAAAVDARETRLYWTDSFPRRRMAWPMHVYVTDSTLGSGRKAKSKRHCRAQVFVVLSSMFRKDEGKALLLLLLQVLTTFALERG